MDELHEARRRRLTENIPSSYRWWLHLFGTTLLGALTIGLALLSVSHLHWADLFTVAFAAWAANGVEWFFHKDLMHRRVPWLPSVYDGHTSEHHMAFTDRDMAVRQLRELKLVMLPFLTLVLAYGVLFVIGIVFGLFRTNVGALWIATGGAYLVLYEWLHALYHLPLVSQTAARMRDHHQRHHDVRLMNRWNFNVTFPIWDRIMGTFFRK